MSADSEFDRSRNEWMIIQRRTATLVENGSFSEAISEIDRFLSSDASPELRSDALGFKADLHEQMGELQKATRELLEAHSLIGPTYVRYVHELRLGDLYRKQAKSEEATMWYMRALTTCEEGDGLSGGSALNAVVSIRGVPTRRDPDYSLCVNVVTKCWRVLGIPGEPDFTNFRSLVDKIRDAESNPPRRPTK